MTTSTIPGRTTARVLLVVGMVILGTVMVHAWQNRPGGVANNHPESPRTISFKVVTNPDATAVDVLVDATDSHGAHLINEENGRPYPFERGDVGGYIHTVFYARGQVVHASFRVFSQDPQQTVIGCQVFNNGTHIRAADSTLHIPRTETKKQPSTVCLFTTSA